MTALPHRPFRFGVQASTAASRREWTELARRVEGSGFSVLTMPDHFDGQLAPVPALMSAADATSTLRVGALVWDNDYKHPVVLAKELATMDVLSEGRLEIGLGAGWLRTDYEQSGIAYDPAPARIDRFVEGIAIIKGALGAGSFSYTGAHYNVTGYDGRPKPIQSPRPPLLIGGGGPRVLSIAAREADIVGINGTLRAGAIGPDALGTMTAAAVEEKVAVVRRAAADRLRDIELNLRVLMLRVTDDRARLIDDLAGMLGMDRDLVDTSPYVLAGSTASIVNDLHARRERWGFSYVIVGADDVETFAPIVAELSGT